MNEEIFKDIPGYEKLYQATNLGRIYSIKSGKILSGTINNSGYYLLGLYKNKICKKYLIHRLVALTFLDNPKNLLEVNHGEGGKLDNSVANLEWTTRSGNQKDAYDRGLIKPHSKSGLDHPFAKTILDTLTGVFYYNLREAAWAKNMGISNLNQMLLGNKTNNTSLIYT